MITTSPRIVGLLLSGGLDSTILLSHLLNRGHRVQPFYIRTNVVWESQELAAARGILETARKRHWPAGADICDFITLDLPLDDLYNDHWSITGRDVPGPRTTDDAVFLPGRNPLLVIKAALWCSLNQIDQLALAPLAANPFPDASDDFFAAYQSALNDSIAGQTECAAVQLVRPFARRTKREVMLLGKDLPLEMTFSCIRPCGRRHCGECNKCAERQAAFAVAELHDPTQYAAVQRTPAGRPA